MQRFSGLIDVSTLKLGTPYWILKLVISPTIINHISHYFTTKSLSNNEKDTIQTLIISIDGGRGPHSKACQFISPLYDVKGSRKKTEKFETWFPTWVDGSPQVPNI